MDFHIGVEVRPGMGVSKCKISSRQINRITDKAGERLRDQQQQRVVDLQNKTLPVEVSNNPDLAVVEFDGGRIRTRETGQGSGTHDPTWKESKTALFMRMSSETHIADPAPEPPPTLMDRDNVGQLAKEIAGAKVPQVDQKEHDQSLELPTDKSSDFGPPGIYKPPKRLMRTCLASLDDSDTFGQLMQAHPRKSSTAVTRHDTGIGDY